MTIQAKNLVELLKASGKTCATAESCTGGMIGGLITAVPGSSDVYLGGVVSYANSVKENVLGVSNNTLESFGAVSGE
ncbi:MAG: CinA family protein [Kiritimatiellae bacterium]|nr:CinA family protein [Kiritimatiellia bacterium]